MLVLRFSRTARRRTLAYTVALLASLAICYHPALALLYRNTGYCYDVFCFFFYYSALAYYLRIRNRGRLPTWKQTASLLTLLVLALDSKEMAVTLPVILAIYELLFWPPARARELPRWLSREGRTAVLGSLVVAAFVIGRVYATPYGLAHQGAYHPDFTVQTWAANWWFWLAAMLDEPSTGEILVVLLTLVVAVLAGPWRKVLVFGLLLAIVGALPVSFIPTRDLSSIYVALLGLAVVAGTLASAAASIVLRGERLAAVRPWLVPAICMTILFARYNSVSRLERSWQDPESMQIRAVLTEFQRKLPHLGPGTRILILVDPFQDQPYKQWASFFLLRLANREQDLALHRLVRLSRPPEPEMLAAYDHVVTFEDNRLIEVPPDHRRPAPDGSGEGNIQATARLGRRSRRLVLMSARPLREIRWRAPRPTRFAGWSAGIGQSM